VSEAPLWLWCTLAGLLFLSGLFSSSETALFSLSARQQVRAGFKVHRLLSQPRRLLVSVLLCNILVNILYFALATRLLPEEGGVGEFGVGLAILVALLICGEILPKTLGLLARVTVARLTAPLLRVAVFVLGPLSRPLRAFLEGGNRLVSLWFPEERGVTSEVLAHIMERGGEEGTLLGVEADLLAEVIELDDIRVREIMTPRVDTLFLDVSEQDREPVVAEALARRLSWLPVVDGSADKIVGRVRVRDLLHRRERPIRQLVMPVKFVPEVASALDLLHALREDRTSEAVVVDEWGGTAGFVTAEDVFEEIVGDLRTEDEARVPAVVPLGEGRYRVAGGLAIRDWNEAFGLKVVPREFETVGGFVTALLGRIPRAGDEVLVGDLEMEVHEVRGRRVTSVDIGVREDEDEVAAGRGAAG
jgi:CBS domain containing-hemolysin-like protein